MLRPPITGGCARQARVRTRTLAVPARSPASGEWHVRRRYRSAGVPRHDRSDACRTDSPFRDSDRRAPSVHVRPSFRASRSGRPGVSAPREHRTPPPDETDPRHGCGTGVVRGGAEPRRLQLPALDQQDRRPAPRPARLSRRQENVVLLGPPGTCKRRLSIALGIRACRPGTGRGSHRDRMGRVAPDAQRSGPYLKDRDLTRPAPADPTLHTLLRTVTHKESGRDSVCNRRQGVNFQPASDTVG